MNEGQDHRAGPAGERPRLDQLLVRRGLVESRAQAQWLIREGRVLCAGRPCLRPGHRVPVAIPLQVSDPLPYVSRGGLKLAHALDTLALSVQGKVALDVGASTGGFSDCLLQRGARRVYAVDVGQGQLHPRLREDPRVVSLEQTDIRDLRSLPGGERADLATVDVSFISLRLVLPAVLQLLRPEGEVIALVKPQFEAGPGETGRRGVVRERRVHRRVLAEVLEAAAGLGLHLAGLCPAPRFDDRANQEYLAYMRRQGPALPLERVIAQALGDDL